jgi:hypothetical protein
VDALEIPFGYARHEPLQSLSELVLRMHKVSLHIDYEQRRALPLQHDRSLRLQPDEFHDTFVVIHSTLHSTVF